MLDPTDAFETWLLHLVREAIEAGDVPGGLLVELQAEVEAARERPQAEGHAAAVRQIAEIAGVDPQTAAQTFAAMEAQPTMTRELLMRRIAEAWLEGQRRAYRDRDEGKGG